MTYAPRLPPYPHQAEALARMRGREAFFLAMAMRTGKTKVILDDFGEMFCAGEAQDLLLVAPGGVYKTWAGELEKHLDPSVNERALVHTWISGPGARAKRELRWFLDQKDASRPRVLLINAEALSVVDLAREAALEFLGQRASVAVVDESTLIKNHAARKTKFLVGKARPLARYRRCLSGLPAPRSPLDLYSQYEFLDWEILGFRSYYAFRNRYAIVKKVDFGGRQVPLVVGYKNVEELQQIVAPHTYRVTLDQVRAALPPVYKAWEVALTAEQRRVYDAVRDAATAQLATGEHVTTDAVIAQILRLRQVLCGHVVDEEGQLHELPDNRTRAVLDVLADYDGKAIIWCAFDHSVRQVGAALAKEYGEQSVARFWGGNRDTREQEEGRFKTDPACRFEVATAAAGGKGRTWDVADLHVFHSNSFDLEHRDQAEMRAEGVTKEVQAARVDLMVPGTVDEKIVQSLRAKIDLAAAVTGDDFREWLI